MMQSQAPILALAKVHQAGRLLAVDTDAQHLIYLSRLLERFGYEVIPARSAMGALEVLKTEVPLLILTELDLPQVGGLELLQRIRMDTRTEHVPVVAMYQGGEAAMGSTQKGFVACLAKPVQAEDLFRAVQAAIEPNRRETMRVETRLTVIVNDRPLECLEGTCSSILSEQGMYIRTLRPHPRDSQLNLQMSVNGRIISADAVVLYSNQFGEGPFGEPGMGIKFSRIDPSDREYLRSFVHDTVVGDLTPEA